MAINKHTKSIMFIISMLIIIFSILCFNAVVIAEEIEDYNDYDEVLLKFLNTVIGENINIDEVEIQAEKDFVYDMNLNKLGVIYDLRINETNGYAIVINVNGEPEVAEMFFDAESPYGEADCLKVYVSQFLYLEFKDGNYFSADSEEALSEAQINAIQDIAYCLFQVLQLAGVVPNSELEDGNNKTQFINALANIGILKHSDKVSYNASVFVWTINGNDFILYRSNKASNTDDLSDTTSWTKILTIDNKNKINFHVDTNISGGSGSSMPVFCFNSGPVDAGGNAALITLSGNTLTLNSPAVGTTASGEVFNVGEDISLDIAELSAGTYNLFYNPDTEGLEIYNNTIYVQKAAPSNMQINDIWVDISVMPYKSYKKISATETEEAKLTPSAVITIISG